VSSPFAGFLARRAAAAVVLVAAVSTSAFVLTHLAPGDATTSDLWNGANAAAIARERHEQGLDRPFVEQLSRWAGGLARFDLGMSSRFRRPVRDLVTERAGPTAELAALSLVLATVIGLPLGVLTGARPRSAIAIVVVPVSLALVACPPLVFTLALLLFAATTGWMSAAQGHLLLPVVAIVAPLAAMLERVQSQATRDALAAPDLLAAAARGIPPARLLWSHAARQSLRPVLGIYGLVIGALFSGSFVVEIVTAWPGLGRLMYEALLNRDGDLVAGCALAGAACLAGGNLVADLARGAIDPRVRDHV
jgi:peptide/nickel transport system permease protein